MVSAMRYLTAALLAACASGAADNTSTSTQEVVTKWSAPAICTKAAQCSPTFVTDYPGGIPDCEASLAIAFQGSLDNKWPCPLSEVQECARKLAVLPCPAFTTTFGSPLPDVGTECAECGL